MPRARTIPKTKRDEARTERALDRFREVLKTRKLRMTGVREAIVREALAYEGHFDIQELARKLQDSGVHDSSLATVYRGMPLLVEAGIVQPTMLSAGGQGHRFEVSFEREHHDHLVCTSCGKVIEFHFEAFEVLQNDIAERYDFVLTNHVHELMGVCGPCRKTEGGKAKKNPS